MKRKEGYMLRKIGTAFMIVPVKGQTICIEEMVTLNETGAYLWEQLEKETTPEELLEAVLSEYDVEKEIATTHIQEFLEKAKQAEIIT